MTLEDPARVPPLVDRFCGAPSSPATRPPCANGQSCRLYSARRVARISWSSLHVEPSSFELSPCQRKLV